MTRNTWLHEIIPVGSWGALALASSLVAWTSPAAADATVYRCGSEGSQWYSQIPCAEDSEPLVIKEQHLLGDANEVPDATAMGGDNKHSAEGNAEAFIAQLEKQRREQLAEIDRNIAKLQHQDANPADGEDDAMSDDKKAALVASLQSTRESILSEYDAMIQAAEQRIVKP